MTITLSLNEIHNLVISRFALPVDTQVDIAGMVKCFAPDVEAFFAAMKQYFRPDGTIDTCFKIPAIKKLREFFPGVVYPAVSILGLGEAKYAIEDWANFSNRIRTDNRLPKLDNGSFVW